jgi:hypothetical protein
MSTFNAILLVAAIATILVGVFEFIDHWSHVKRLLRWVRGQVPRLKIDSTPVVRTIPPPEPITTTSTPDGVHKTLKKYIFRGTQQQLMASEITRDGFAGTRFLVEFIVVGQQPKSMSTANRDGANIQWHKWYQQWKQEPGGFGGTFGTGLDGTLPW